MWFFSKPAAMPTEAEALPGRSQPVIGPLNHAISGRQLRGPYPDGTEIAEFALGCFWGEEKTFWEQPGVWTTAVGYEGGFTPNPTYQESCTGKTGHAEVVKITFNPEVVSCRELLEIFFTMHDPTTLNRQGNDVGTQYRSAIFFASPQQQETARQVIAEMGNVWDAPVVTELGPLKNYYKAEEEHQNYFLNHPLQGYSAFVVEPKVTTIRKIFAE
jgi:peptide-methionine (S)-S-oxide reductase